MRIRVYVLIGGLLGLLLAVGSHAQNTDPNNDTGIHLYETYDGTRENINLGSGNVFVSVPLLTLTGRNGHNYSVGLIANSQSWSVPSNWQNHDIGMLVTRTGNIYFHPSGTVNPAPGIQCTSGYTLSDENGGVHTFSGMQSDCIWVGGGQNQGMREPQYDSLGGSDDRGEGIHADLSACKLTFRNGTWIPLHSGSGGCPLIGVIGNGAYTPVFEDSNGNEISVNATNGTSSSNYVAGGGDLLPTGTDLDTLGRSIIYSKANHTIQYKDSNGVLRTITLNVQPFTLSCTFAATGGAAQPSGTVNVISSVVLPNGLSYIFQYDGCGSLNKIVYPSGGYTRYVFDYSSYTHATPPPYSVVVTDVELTQKYVCRAAAVAAGTTSTGPGNTCPVAEDLTTYAPTITSSMCNNSATSVVDPMGNKTSYQFTNAQGSGCNLYSVLETQRQIYQGSSTLLQTVQTQYSGTVAQFPSIQTTILPNNQQSQVQWDYWNLDFLKEKREYAFGQGAPGAPVRTTDYGQNYCYDKKPSETVYAGSSSGTMMSQTTYEFDNYTAGLAQSGAGQHDSSYNYNSGLTTGRCNVTAIERWRNTDGATLTTRMQYDDAGNVLSSTDPGLHTTNYSYADAWNEATCKPSSGTGAAYLTQITNALGQITNNTYKSCSGRLATTTDPNNQQTSFSYDYMDRTIQVNYPDTGQTTFSYNGDPAPPHITKTVLATPNPSIITDQYYDGLSRISSTQLSDPQGADTTVTNYDGVGHVSQVYNPTRCNPATTNCGESTWGYTSYSYDALGRTTVVTKQDGNSVQTDYSAFPTVTVKDETGRQRRSTTDALGRVVEVDEPADQVVTPMSNPTAGTGSVSISGTEQSWQTSPATAATGSVTISGSEQSTTIYFPCNCSQWGCSTCSTTAYDGGTVSVTVNGVAEAYSYNQSDTSSSIASGLANRFNSDGSSLVTASVSGSTVYLTAKATGASTNYSLSAATTNWNNQNFSSPSFSPSTSGSSLAGGQDAQYAYDSGTTSITVNGHATSLGWGQGATASGIAGALASNINSDSGAAVTASASGTTINLTAKVQGSVSNYALSTSTSSQRGSFSSSASGGSLTGGSNPQQTGPLYHVWSFSPASVTLYSYDVLDNLTCAVQKGTDTGAFTNCSAAPATWRPRSFSYDSFSRLLSSSNPEAGTITYSYATDSTCNPAGENLRTKTDARGVTTTYCYDALHRVTQKTFSDSTPALYFSYDVAPSWMTDLTNVKGRLVEAYNQYAGSSGSIAAAFVNSYDQMGRVIRQWQQTPSTSPGGYFVYPAYDVAGQIKSLTYPSGRVINYQFNSSARLNKAYSTAGGEYDYLNVSAFWPTAPWQTATYGNGTKQQDTYSPRLQPTELKLLTPAGGSIADRQYVWTGCAEGVSNGNNGNVCGINDALNSARNQSYNFDALNRIVSGIETDGAFNQTMSYDVWGNASIAGPSGGSRSYNTQNRDTAYGYDAAGNLTNDGTYTYAYNAEEQISSLTSNSTGAQVANYVYDADGNRARKNVGSSWTEYIYFGGNVIAENSPSGWTDYIFAGGKRIAQVSASGTQYYWDDHLGTTKMTLDASGNSQCYAIYTPFGSEVSGCPTHYKFTGKERDSEDGLDYFGARYYSSNMGRWMSPDWADKPEPVPYADLSDPQSLNLYGYVRNNPMSKADADGHCCDIEPALEEIDRVVGPLIESAAATTERAVLGTVVGVVGVVLTPTSAGSTHENQMEQQMRQEGTKSEQPPEPEASASGSGARKGGGNRTFQTYTKTNPDTGEVYSGMTSGTGTPQENVARRDSGHQKNAEGFGPAALDQSSSNRGAIRGREQQLHEHFQAQGKSANINNPVGARNPKAQKYRDAANKEFGPVQ